MTPAQKKAYNEKYYREHSNYWKDFYSKGRLVGRQKHVTDGGLGVHRRGQGLGTGPVGGSKNGKRSVDATGAVDSWANLVGQTGDVVDSYAYNNAMDIPSPYTLDWEPWVLQEYVDSGGGTIYDNIVYSAAEAHGILSKTAKKGKAAVSKMLGDWNVGARSIRSLFKKKGRR